MKASLNSSTEQCVHPQYGSYECTCVYVDHSKPTACVDATFFWCSEAFKHKIERPNILIFDFDVQKFRDGIRTLAQIFTHCVKKVRPSGGNMAAPEERDVYLLASVFGGYIATRLM